jgi:hypothetical protein
MPLVAVLAVIEFADGTVDTCVEELDELDSYWRDRMATCKEVWA